MMRVVAYNGRKFKKCWGYQSPNIKTLVTTARGEITLGAMAGIECVATASDEAQCLAMLVKGDNETLDELLHRLDRAIEQAQENACLIDEINTNP